MTAVLIDANVLLDVMTEDARWLAWSAGAIERAADRYRLVINPVIYAEVSIRFSRIEELDIALPGTMFDREAIPVRSGFYGGQVVPFLSTSGGTKRSPLPDFFIGAHAAVAGYLLMTRDVTRYRTYEFCPESLFQEQFFTSSSGAFCGTQKTSKDAAGGGICGRGR